MSLMCIVFSKPEPPVLLMKSIHFSSFKHKLELDTRNFLVVIGKQTENW